MSFRLLQALKGPVKCLRLPSLSPTMEKGMVVKWHINHGKMTKEYDLFATMNVLALTDDVFAPDAAVTKNPARDTSANNLTTMLIEIHEELYVAKLFQTPFGRMSPVDTPLALLCEHPDDVETVSGQIQFCSEFTLYDVSLCTVHCLAACLNR